VQQTRRPGTRTGYRGRVVVYLVLFLLLCLSVPLVLRGWTDLRYKKRIYTVESAPSRPAAIVFGAGVWPGGRLSAVLEDRVQTAVDLYRLGKVQKLLLTGDNSTLQYNEPGHMRAYALQLGVPDEDIVLDYAGRRTYDSCYRAKEIFGLREAILVTQSFHLDRALFTADHLGLDVVGVEADRRQYTLIQRYWWREFFATSLAYWEVLVARPEPILGDKLPIFPDGHEG
jgi:SanA protein